MTHDVFICHSSKDRTIANAICSTLEQHKIRCWIAPRDVLPGSEYAGSIVAAITASKLTILVFSSNSNDSQHVRREIERSVSHGLPVLPFRVEDVVPHPSLEYFISGAHWLDAMTPPLEQHLDHLVGTVRLLLEREAATAAGVSDASAAASSPTRASTPATPIPPPLPADRAPGAGATVGGARPTRRRPSTAVLAAIGAVAIVALAVGTFFLSGGGRPSASQTAALPSASPAPIATPGPTLSPGVTPTSAPSPGLTATPGGAIAQITAALPTSLACDPPETPSAESIELATVFCYVGDATVAFVHYTLYPNVSALRNDYGSWLDYYELGMGTSGSCANGDRMEEAWSFKSTPSTTEGHYFCVVDDENQANLYWTDEASLILVDLAGDTDVTLDKLYPIWRDRTYDPVRP